jgi:drug/metabolite transporter (DMT)-like permease
MQHSKSFNIELIGAAMLAFAAVSWAGNYVVGRAIAGDVPPAGHAVVRWALSAVLLLPFAWQHLSRDWPLMRRHWPMTLFLTVSGGAVFGTLHFAAMERTTAINGGLIGAMSPVLIAVAGALLFRDPLSLTRIAGLAVSIVGVLLIISRADPSRIASLSFNVGDVMVLANIVNWAVYSACLRRKPKVHWLSFTLAIAVVGSLANIPLAMLEAAHGLPIRPDTTTFLTVVYTGAISAALAFAAWNQGVEYLGSQRAGPFLYLVPVFSVLLAWVFLGEVLYAYHAAGFALILAGIWLSAR